MALKPEAREANASPERAPAASSSDTHDAEAKIWDNIPLPSVADPSEPRMMTPKTLLDCCRCAQEFVDEYDLADGLDVGELNVMRAIGHRTCAFTQFTYLQEASKNKDKENYLLSLVNLLRLVCWMAQKVGLESVLSAAFSVKHETDMKKSLATLTESSR